jgi:undecaprenyl-phosphate galactose phosphotransferase
MNSSEKTQTLSFLAPRSFSGSLAEKGFPFYRQYFKRVFDIFFAPLLLLLIILIRIDSRGRSIYRSERIGKAGKIFYCLKLRTMCANADEKLSQLLQSNPILEDEYKKTCKIKNDPRVTRIGKFLRATSLDELPQIFNVLKGEMSFVGPRPILLEEKDNYGVNFELYKKIRPGVTGIWQVSGRNDADYPRRIEYLKTYIQECKPTFDLMIMLKTIPVVILRRGAY